jgi:hypothetical protein
MKNTLKKVFLINFSSHQQIETALILRQKGIEITYWVGRKNNFDNFYANYKQDFHQTIFHNAYDAMKGIPAENIDENDFIVPGKNIFDQLQKCELQSLVIMSRIDYENTPLIKQRNLFCRYVKYWFGVLVRFRPDAVIFPDIPHNAFTYVIYCLARILGIQTIMYKRTKGILDGLLFFNDFTDYKKLREEYKKVLATDFTLDDLSEQLRDYYLKEIDIKSKAHLIHNKETYSYIKEKSKGCQVVPSAEIIAKNIKKGTFWRTAKAYLSMLFSKKRIDGISRQVFWGWQLNIMNYKWNKMKDRYRKEYEGLQIQPDFSRNYVYVPLHLQPECTTNPMGDIFDSQILMLEVLSAALPENWIIYVKENPMQWKCPQGYVGRYEGYYRAMAKIKNVFLIPAATSTYELMLNAKAVATVTGTAAWEGILRGTPAILFGYTWFMDCEGVFKAQDADSCRQALNTIKSGYQVDQNKVIKFLGAVDKIMVKGYSAKKFGRFSKVTPEENIRNISEALYKEIISI